jgi:hypothetical protein
MITFANSTGDQIPEADPKRNLPTEEEEELREIRDLFWKYIANPKYAPDPDEEEYPIWTKLK